MPNWLDPKDCMITSNPPIVFPVVITAAFYRNPLFRFIKGRCDLLRIVFEKDVKLVEQLQIPLLELAMMDRVQLILDLILGLKQQVWTDQVSLLY